MRRWWVAAMLVASFVSAWGQSGKVTFHFVRSGVPVPEYTFVVTEFGSGTYTAVGVPVNASTNKYSVAASSQPVKTVQDLALNKAAVDKVFALARSTNGLRGCASKAKGIADTGAKQIIFQEDASLEISCRFNYSESKPVAELTQYFQAMAYTLDEARKMEGEQRFDRLGLDGEMTTLVAAVKNGQAMGLSNIRGVLQGLVDDPAVLERVRVQAGKLLEQSLVTP